jgi:hypothetical protein
MYVCMYVCSNLREITPAKIRKYGRERIQSIDTHNHTHSHRHRQTQTGIRQKHTSYDSHKTDTHTTVPGMMQAPSLKEVTSASTPDLARCILKRPRSRLRRKNRPRAGSETECGGLDDRGLEHCGMQIDNSVSFIAITIDSTSHPTCGVSGGWGEGTID